MKESCYFQEIHSIVDDLSVRLGGVGDEWLTSSESSPKYFEFTPIEMHAITERLRLPEPTAPGVLSYTWSCLDIYGLV